MRTSNKELAAIVERVNSMYEEELTDETDDGETVEFELFHRHESGVHRICVRPVDMEYGTGISNLGPGFSDRNELVAFVRGLEFGTNVDWVARHTSL